MTTMTTLAITIDMGDETLRTWLSFFSIVLAILTAGLSTWFSLRQQKLAKRASDYNLFEKYNDDYFRPELGESFRTLGRLKSGPGQNCPVDPAQFDRWVHLMRRDRASLEETDRQWMDAIDRARRHVKSYYHKLAMLYLYKVIDRSKIFTLCEKGGVYLYLNVVWELEKAQYPDSPDMRFFETVDRIVRRNRQQAAAHAGATIGQCPEKSPEDSVEKSTGKNAIENTVSGK